MDTKNDFKNYDISWMLLGRLSGFDILKLNQIHCQSIRKIILILNVCY